MATSLRKRIAHFDPAPVYKAYHLGNFRDIPQLARFGEDRLRDIDIVGRVLPFKTNNFVVDRLIDWDKGPDELRSAFGEERFFFREGIGALLP